MINLCPTETPLGEPVLISFVVRDRVYVVDVWGSLFLVQTEPEDPDMWQWQTVCAL